MRTSRTFTPIEVAVIQTLTYFDIFSYPLTGREVTEFLGMEASGESVMQALSSLAHDGLIRKTNDFFSLRESTARAERRVEGNRRAMTHMARARRRGRLIGRFPFVRGVMISGSLSKGYLSESGDYDYFVITSPGRLWVARLLLTLFKRIFLLNRHRYFCINYLISEDNLEIEEKNLYTATELATVIPVYGGRYLNRLHNCNRWALAYLPNQFKGDSIPTNETQPVLKRMMEGLLNGRAGEKIDQFSQQLFRRQWTKKYSHQLTPAEFELAFKSTRSVSKLHPRNFQGRVLAQLYKRMLRVHSRTEALPI
jgi:hypothetical protein